MNWKPAKKEHWLGDDFIRPSKKLALGKFKSPFERFGETEYPSKVKQLICYLIVEKGNKPFMLSDIFCISASYIYDFCKMKDMYAKKNLLPYWYADDEIVRQTWLAKPRKEIMQLIKRYAVRSKKIPLLRL